MLLNLLEYHWAETIDDALMLLSRVGTRTVPLAGGTYLLGLQDEEIQAVVDLRDLELSSISEDAKGVHIGAMTTLQNMVEAPLLKELAAGILSRAAQASSFSRLLRNSATLGGTLGAWVASQADLLTALAVLDAEVVVRSGSRTQVNLEAGTVEHPGLALSGVTFKGKQERRIAFGAWNTERHADELILEVIVPRPIYGSGAAFMRVGRTPTDIALLNVAALVEIADGAYKHVRLALGGVNMEPIRLYSTEQQLEGQPIEGAGSSLDNQRLLAALQTGITDFQPPSDMRASNAYRRVSGAKLAYRALEEAMNIARWRSSAGRSGRS